jgi:hypothetical protein
MRTPNIGEQVAAAWETVMNGPRKVYFGPNYALEIPGGIENIFTSQRLLVYFSPRRRHVGVYCFTKNGRTYSAPVYVYG